MSTLLLLKQKKYLKYPLKQFLVGLKQVKLILLQLHLEEKDIISRTYITLLVAIQLLIKNKKSVIVGYLPPSKCMILNDSKIFLEKNSLLISWLQMSVQGLIGKEKVLKPFWNNQCKEISQKLWLPIETDYVDSHLNFWNGSSQVMGSNSWFSMKIKNIPQTKSLQTTYFPSYTFIPVEKWEEEGIRTRKIRLYPTQKQKLIMKRWIGTRRFVYNRVLEKLKKKEDTKINFFALRNKYVIAKNNPLVEEWQLETPKDIRAGAVRDLVKNYTSAFSLLKKRQIQRFNMRFISKKETQSIEISKTAIKLSDKSIFIYKSYIPDKIKIGKREKLDLNMECDCRLKVENDKWFLCIPIKVVASKTEERYNKKEFCSIDPGTRNFQTIYSEDILVQVKINEELVKKLQKKIDNFKSLRDKKIIKRKRYKRRERKTYFKINNLIDDLHFKTINYLVKTFNHIIIPSFETQKMASKNSIKSVNRNLLQLKHYLYRQRLEAKCLLEKCTIDICTEEYTSKTCGQCGTIKNIGNKDIYCCNKCNLIIDRDVNGARNIAIKRLKETL